MYLFPSSYTYLRPTNPAIITALNELVRNLALLVEQTSSSQLITYLDDQNPYLQRCADSLPDFKGWRVFEHENIMVIHSIILVYHLFTELACGIVNNSSSIGYHVALMPLSPLHNGIFYTVEFTKLLAYPMAIPINTIQVVRNSNHSSQEIIAYVSIVLEVRYFKLRAQDPDLSPADEMCFNVAIGHIGVSSTPCDVKGESLTLDGLGSSFRMPLGDGGLLSGLGGLGFSLGMSIDPSPPAASSPNLQAGSTGIPAEVVSIGVTNPPSVSESGFLSTPSTSDEQHRANQERMDKPANFKPGDWMCECGDHVFAKKTACFKCGAPKPAWVLPPPIPIVHQSNSITSSSSPPVSAGVSNTSSVSNNGGGYNSFGNGNIAHTTVKDLTVKERNKQRTDVCYAFQRGECTRGSSCRFVHILEKRNREKKDRANEICYQFQRGECSRGAACRFLHAKENANDNDNIVNSGVVRSGATTSGGKGCKK